MEVEHEGGGAPSYKEALIGTDIQGPQQWTKQGQDGGAWDRRHR